MKIAIIDCEFSEGLAIAPNPWLMKISSYYKQLGYDSRLVDNVTNPSSYFKVFISKDSPYSSLPDPALLIAENVELLGSQFIRFDNKYELEKEVVMARPDYGLYKFEFQSELTEASYVAHIYNRESIKTQNQFRNHRALPRTIVIDEDPWSIDGLSEYLDEISEYRKLEFLYPIDIKKINNSILLKKFSDLRFLNHSFKVKMATSVEELEQVIFVLNEIRKLKNISFGEIEFLSTPGEVSLERMRETIKAIELANRSKVKIKIIVPNGAIAFVGFIRYKQKQSYFDYLLKSEYNLSPIEIMENPQTQNNIYVKMIKQFKDEETLQNGFTEWGGAISPTIKTIRRSIDD